MKCKTFDAIIKELNYHPEKSKRWLEDKRLTMLEKKIISGYMMVRNNQNEDVIAELTTLGESDIEFVNSHRDLLLGICYNNTTRFHLAEKHLLKSIQGFEQNQLHYHLFTARFDLFMVYSNLVNLPKMKSVLDEMEKMRLDGKLAQIRLMRCQFIYADEAFNVESGWSLNKKLNALKPEMAESDLIAHLVSEFMFYIKQDEFDLAQDVLMQMKKHRKFHLSENFNFMKRLMDHHRLGMPIYAYDREFKNIPLLFHQLKVIQAFESQEKETAQFHWQELQKIAPEIHGPDFVFKGGKGLFAICLEKYLHQEKPVELTEVSEGSKVEIFYQLMIKAQGPLQKGLVYEILWGTSPEDKDDYKRLTRLVSKVRDRYGIDIQTRKGTYFLSPTSQKASKKVS